MVALRQLRLPCPTASKTTTFLFQLRSSRSMDRSAHTTARLECFVCGVDDRVDVQCRDVGLNCAKRDGHDRTIAPHGRRENSVIDWICQCERRASGCLS